MTINELSAALAKAQASYDTLERNERMRNERIAATYLAGGMTMQEIADEYGISRERVRQIIRRYEQDHGLTKTVISHAAAPEVRECALASCGGQFKCQPYSLRRYCSSECGKFASGQALTSPVITRQWDEIVAAFEAGDTCAIIGKKFGVSTMTVYRHLSIRGFADALKARKGYFSSYWRDRRAARGSDES